MAGVALGVVDVGVEPAELRQAIAKAKAEGPGRLFFLVKSEAEG